MAKTQDPLDNIIEKVKENYISALIGLVIFVLGVGFVANSLSDKKGEKGTTTTNSIKNIFTGDDEEVKEEVKEAPEAKTYTVKKGDTLWSIAEGQTGSGYNFTDLATANKLKNADMLEVGQKLTLPEMKPMTKTVMAPDAQPKGESQAKITITGDTYTVVAGDTLWSISERAYGTGYSWTQIATANKLKNANRIEKGQKLTLPRK